MKNKIVRLTAKALLSVSMIGGLFLLNSCGNSSEPKAGETTAPPKSMIADAPKDDGQGLGKFKNVALASLDSKLAAQGKSVFEAKCTACHNPTEVKKVGPGLKGVTERRSGAWIMNMISNPAEMTQKDPTAKDLLGQHLVQMTFQDVSDEQVRQLLEFLRENDKTGSAQAAK